MPAMNENKEIVEADPRARRNAITVVCLSAVFASFLVYLISSLEGRMQYWLEDNIELLINSPWIVFLASLILVSPLLWGAFYLFKYGSAVVKHQQIPAPGYGMIRRMTVTHGRAAIAKGRLVQILSALILVTAGSIPVLLTLLFVWIGTQQ